MLTPALIKRQFFFLNILYIYVRQITKIIKKSIINTSYTLTYHTLLTYTLTHEELQKRIPGDLLRVPFFLSSNFFLNCVFIVISKVLMVQNITGGNNLYNSLNPIQIKVSDVRSGESAPQNLYEAPSIKVACVEKKDKRNGFTIAGVSIGGALLLTLVGFATLSKGASSGLYKKLKRFSSDLKRKSYDLAVDYKNLTFIQKTKLQFAKIVEPVTNFLEASSNLNVLKDGAVMQVMKTCGMKGLVDVINNSFKNIVLKTKNNAYKSAELSGVRFCSYIEQLAKNSPDKAFEFAKFSEDISKAYYDNFSVQHHFRRSENMWNSLADLHSRVWNSFKIFSKNDSIFSKSNRERLKSYMTMDMCEKERNEMLRILKQNKQTISNNIADNHHLLKENLNNFKIHVNPKNPEAVSLMQDLEAKISQYEKLSGQNENEQRTLLCSQMKDIVFALKKHLDGGANFNPDALISKFTDILDANKTKKGLVQDALTLLKDKFGKESKEYKEAKKLADEFNKNMNNAISTELVAYEKFAELQMGSAPTDILGILAPTALGTALVISAKDKDQRITNTLTQGIPIIGGIGTAYYGTTRMLTGPTNMALGLISGALLSVIGSKVDEMYKNYQQRQHTFKTEFEALKKAQQAATAAAKDAANIILKPSDSGSGIS